MMLHRSWLMNENTKEKIPMDQQVVEVRLADSEWQQAIYKDGEFVDAYGIPLDRKGISSWRPSNTRTSGANHA